MTDPMHDSPLVTRYASREMVELWSPQRRILEWRRLWLSLAEAQAELGLPITPEQLAELRDTISHINWQAAEDYERKLRHDVMAHVHAWGELCPTARGILHWGATSCFVTDNADLVLMREALGLIRLRLVRVIDRLGAFAQRFRALPCLAMTHLQPAQPTTVGKRACLWAYDLCLDVQELELRLRHFPARSIKGTTGTQASFLQLFQGDHDKVRQLEQRVAQKIGFHETFAVTGQTYPRKFDAQVLHVLSGIAQSAHKAASDIRLLCSRKEIDEPFEASQIGSSAMAYKRNPMRSERICGLARFLIHLAANADQTAAQQWLERTLDDSANRRLILPQAFLTADAILILYDNIAAGLTVYPEMIRKNLQEELPFMATESLLMAAVARGADRQQAHEIIRRHSQEVAQNVKLKGETNNLLARLEREPHFAGLDFSQLLDATQFVGRAPEQVDEFLASHVEPLRQQYPEALALQADVQV